MQIQKKTRDKERIILQAMLVDDIVLSKISSKWTEKGLFASRWANLIGGWCVKYYHKYSKAPAQQIQTIYEQWASKTKDEDTLRLVEKFLSSLDADLDYLKQSINSDFIVDLAGQYFNQIKLENLTNQIKSLLEEGEIDQANAKIQHYTKLELGNGEGINVFHDEEAVKQVFKEKKETLIRYPGALGKFFKGQLERDAFIAFLAPEKRGKSWILLDMAYRAMLQNRKVAFFEAGDMSQNQVMRRLLVRVAKWPIRKSIVRIPVEISRSPEDVMATVSFKQVKFDSPLDLEKAEEACKKLITNKIKTDEPLFKLSCHPNSTLSVAKIRSILRDWEKEDWIPDIIIIDYADILDMNYPGLEGRDRINEVWKQLRGMSQTYHCLVVTATQANAASYRADTIDRTHFSEDKRKLAHVTGMIGINCTLEEKQEQLLRLNWIALREADYDSQACVHVASCLELGNPMVLSCF